MNINSTILPSVHPSPTTSSSSSSYSLAPFIPESTTSNSSAQTENRVNQVAQQVVSASQQVSSSASASPGVSRSVSTPTQALSQSQGGRDATSSSDSIGKLYGGRIASVLYVVEGNSFMVPIFLRGESSITKLSITIDKTKLSRNASEIVVGLKRIIDTISGNPSENCAEVLEEFRGVLDRVYSEDMDTVHYLVSYLFHLMSKIHQPMYETSKRSRISQNIVKVAPEVEKSLQVILDRFIKRLMEENSGDDALICLMLMLSPLSYENACPFHKNNKLIFKMAFSINPEVIQHISKKFLETEINYLKQNFFEPAYKNIKTLIFNKRPIPPQSFMAMCSYVKNFGSLLFSKGEIENKEASAILDMMNLISYKADDVVDLRPIKDAFSSFISEMSKDRELFLKFISEFGAALKYADDALKNDREVVAAAIKNNIFAFKHASKDLQDDGGLKSQVLNINPLFSACIESSSDKEGSVEAIRSGFEALSTCSLNLKRIEQRMKTNQAGQQEFDTENELLKKTYSDLKVILVSLRQIGCLYDMKFATKVIDQLVNSLKDYVNQIRELDLNERDKNSRWTQTLIGLEKMCLPILIKNSLDEEDRGIICLLVKKYSRALLYVSEHLRNDKEIVSASVGIDL